MCLRIACLLLLLAFYVVRCIPSAHRDLSWDWFVFFDCSLFAADSSAPRVARSPRALLTVNRALSFAISAFRDFLAEYFALCFGLQVVIRGDSFERQLFGDIWRNVIVENKNNVARDYWALNELVEPKFWAQLLSAIVERKCWVQFLRHSGIALYFALVCKI